MRGTELRLHRDCGQSQSLWPKSARPSQPSCLMFPRASLGRSPQSHRCQRYPLRPPGGADPTFWSGGRRLRGVHAAALEPGPWAALREERGVRAGGGAALSPQGAPGTAPGGDAVLSHGGNEGAHCLPVTRTGKPNTPERTPTVPCACLPCAAARAPLLPLGSRLPAQHPSLPCSIQTPG